MVTDKSDPIETAIIPHYMEQLSDTAGLSVTYLHCESRKSSIWWGGAQVGGIIKTITWSCLLPRKNKCGRKVLKT